MAGNANSGRKQEKPFADALRMELAAAGEDHKALRAIAKKLIDMATEGKMDAINLLVERTDGKVAVQIAGEDGGPIQVQIIKRVYGDDTTPG